MNNNPQDSVETVNMPAVIHGQFVMCYLADNFAVFSMDRVVYAIILANATVETWGRSSSIYSELSSKGVYAECTTLLLALLNAVVYCSAFVETLQERPCRGLMNFA
jgi:hypothetical protein